MSALFFECGCCGEFHKPLEPSPYLATALYLSDCRNDGNRFAIDHPEVEAAEHLGLIEWDDDDAAFMANFEEVAV